VPAWTRLFMGGFTTIAMIGSDASAAECLTSSGKTACGFHCVAANGDVRCSQTPEGVCSTGSGVVVCWDPPPVLRRVFGERVPAASCVTTLYQTACGYSCETSNDRAQCAQTPFGECQVSDGRSCWDHPPRARQTAAHSVAECISSSRSVADTAAWPVTACFGVRRLPAAHAA
jgi:hypothetical protein